MKVPAALMLLLAALMLAEMAYMYPGLPDPVASHFGAGGEADGWSSKRAYAILMISVVGGLIVFIALPALFLHRLPNGLINMPHKEYWLAPERREASLNFMRSSLLWIGVATLALVAKLNSSALRANMQAEPRLDSSSAWGFGVYMAFVLGSVVFMYRRFPRPPAS